MVIDSQVNSCVAGQLSDSTELVRSGELASALLYVKSGRIAKTSFWKIKEVQTKKRECL